MTRTIPASKYAVSLLLALAALVGAPAVAGGVTLTLARTTLTNVPDAAGNWQYESGLIRKGAVTVGQYMISRRHVSGGSTNAGMQTLALIFADTQAVTVQGVHSFTDGVLTGSVSSASNRFTWIVGADARITPNGLSASDLVLRWTGSDQLTLP